MAGEVNGMGSAKRIRDDDKKIMNAAPLTPDEKKTIVQMVDASVEFFRKRRAKEKRGSLDATHVYSAFMQEIGRRVHPDASLESAEKTPESTQGER